MALPVFLKKTMADFNITIEGLDETVAMLENAPRTLVARGYRKALQAAAGCDRQRSPGAHPYQG